jgi:peroxiredoxin Q/BCP
MSLVRFLCEGILLSASILGGTIAAAGESAGADDPAAESAAPATVAAPTTPDASAAPAPGAPQPATKSPSGGTPEVGSAALDFSLTNSEGKETALKDYRGKWVVLYFYPKDFTGGCTLEAHNFQRDLAKYDQLNTVILGVSVDSPESHKEFCAKEQLTFKLLSDPEAKLSAKYGSVMEYDGAKLSARNTFIISPQGKIAKVFTKVSPAGHSEEVLAALGELQKSWVGAPRTGGGSPQ